MPVAVRNPKVSKERQVAALRIELGLSQEALAQALGVSSRTVARWEEGGASPSPLALTRLRLLAEIREKASRLFKGKQAEAWLRTPNPVLGGRPPLDRLRAPGGLEEIRDLLGRIEWGIPT
jgi:putative toxin-antitoxin system antitoxin component (TIGR02293 family)